MTHAAVSRSRAERRGPALSDDRERLEQTWREAGGLRGWLTSVSHKAIGRRYIVTALVFFVLGGIEALLMRLQLARPDQRFLGPELYNQLFSVHGSTMMFLFAVPVMEGFGVYLVPLMVGTRNVAFPRLNAFGYYAYLIGGLLLYSGFLAGHGADTGWFSYVPLANLDYARGKGVDIWAQMITFTELSALVVAVELVVTIMKQRAVGMSLDRIPPFAWAMLVMSVMILIAMPAIMLASGLLALDRLVGTHFFDPADGADPLLWQHLFWFFGHPEVYIIFVPALGMVSSIVVAAARRPLVGYTAVVFALVATGVMGFGLWVHHMFATGLPQLGESFFTAAGMMIAIPTGLQFFCWIATLWRSRPRLTTPLLFVLGFLAVFLVGGLTGVMVASVPFDLQVHDTFFVVAHLHYALLGGAVFPLFGALYFWWPKMTGRRLSDRLGRWHLALLFVGFNLTFFPMHQLGFAGMPRRVYTYPAELPWGALNLLATVGAGIIAVSVILFAVNAAWSLRRGPVAGDNPWDADTLEWATASPPPDYAFFEPPVVRNRHPLWGEGPWPGVRGLRTDRREILVTHTLDALPDHRSVLPGPSVWPLALAGAVGVGFVGVVFTPWAIPPAAALTLAALLGWFWPRSRAELTASAPGASVGGSAGDARLDVRHLPELALDSRGLLWWGQVLMVVIEGAMIVMLTVTYFYYRVTMPAWPPAGTGLPRLGWPTAGLLLLLASGVPMAWADRRAAAGDRRGVLGGLGLGIGLALAALAARLVEWRAVPARWDSHVYGSVVWAILGLHTAHLVTATVEAIVLVALVARYGLADRLRAGVVTAAPYWDFVLASWVPLYAVLYLVPRLT